MDNLEYLRGLTYSRQEIDDWFAGHAYPFSKYDSEFGYLHRSGRRRDGANGSLCTYSYDENNSRRMVAFAGQNCRINTYGNSFTNCDQVNDGQTWQEVVAAKIGEPVRNYGVSSFSVYQAYLRMKREEINTPADYIIFNIFDDDHQRNLSGWQRINFLRNTFLAQPTVPSVTVDLRAGTLLERKNACPTPESVYNLCDPDWVCGKFGKEFMLEMRMSYIDQGGGVGDSLAQFALAHPTFRDAGLWASMRIVEKAEAFAAANRKRILWLLSYNGTTVAETLRQGTRFDREFIDFMKQNGLCHVDLLKAHQVDFASFNGDVDEYLKQYYIGHYNTAGNVFTASAIVEKLAEMLDPGPALYRSST